MACNWRATVPSRILKQTEMTPFIWAQNCMPFLFFLITYHFSHWKSSQLSFLSCFENDLPNFKKYFSASKEVSDSVSKCILHHLSGALFHDCWKDDAKVDNAKEDNVWWIFDQLGGYFSSIFNTRERHALWVSLLFDYLLWRLHLLQLCQLASQAHSQHCIRQEELQLHAT